VLLPGSHWQRHGYAKKRPEVMWIFREVLDTRDGVHEATRAHDCDGRTIEDSKARRARNRERQ
jgi:hypothetical protein